jgi:hypothetical protein
MYRWSAPAWLLAAFTLVACADPPNKEMDQAQGAIDAARAAGADRYATAEFKAAGDALKQAQDAVTAGDYRLALNYALDSRERAQNAAREAADTRARLRGDVERSMAEFAPRLAQANARLQAAQRARLPARTLRAAADDLAAANADVQKAGEAVKADDYPAARLALERAKERAGKATAAIDAVTRAQSRRRRT